MILAKAGNTVTEELMYRAIRSNSLGQLEWKLILPLPFMQKIIRSVKKDVKIAQLVIDKTKK